VPSDEDDEDGDVDGDDKRVVAVVWFGNIIDRGFVISMVGLVCF
jgi:hypothetical protein